MRLLPDSTLLGDYLRADDVIDHPHPLVRTIAEELRRDASDDAHYAKVAFEYVRDQVTHSLDTGDRRTTWRASDVLTRGTGLCYAKSHALVALLRAQGIQAGMCYQRIAGDEDGSTHVLHGLVGLLLPAVGDWVRVDPRGNKPGIAAEFSLGEEQLAYRVRPALGEVDYPTVYVRPHPIVLEALQGHDDCIALCEGHLPSVIPD